MNLDSIIYLYDEKNEYFDKLQDFCTKVNICFFECQSMELMLYLVKNIKPKFIVVSSKLMTHPILCDFCQTYSDCIVYVLNDEIMPISTSNLYFLNTFNDLQILLESHIQYYANTNTQNQKYEKMYYELVHNELDKLSFRQKLIGAKYISELIYEILTSTAIYNGKCSDLYPKLAIKYNTTTGSIERAMRFAIQQSYKISQNKNLFYEISKCNKAPTVKELTNYILDKVVLQANKRYA